MSKLHTGQIKFAGIKLIITSACWLAVLSLFHVSASAATLSWSGGGANNNWSDSGNWGFAGTPANGDILIFPAAQPRLINTNNISSLTLNQVRFVGAGGGYAIYGNSVIITNGIEATNSAGVNVISNNITLGTPGNFTVNVATGAKLFFGGTLSGSVGLIKTGGGTNTLGGGFDNTYSGVTGVSNGVVELSKFGASATAVPHDLVIGDGVNAATVRHLAGTEIANTGNVTVNRLSTLDLADRSDVIAALTLTGGTVTTGTGTLTLGGDVTTLSSITTATISGNLSLGGVTRTFSVGSGSANPDLLVSAVVSGTGGAGITKTGVGTLTLSGANTYTGPTVIDGFVILANDSALGASGFSTNGTTVNASDFLLVQGVDIGNEFLTLAGGADFRSSGTASWAGPVTLNGNVAINAFSGTFTISGAISGVGGFTKGQSGTLILNSSAPYTYDGPVVVNTGVLQLSSTSQPIPFGVSSLTIGDDVGGADADVVRETVVNQINANVPIIINSSGLLDLNGFSDDVGALTFNGGHITTGSGGLLRLLSFNVTVNSNNAAMAVIDGDVELGGTRTFTTVGHFWSPDLKINAAIRGSGGLTKDGVGEIGLTSSNNYAGATTVNDGFLIVDHSFALGTTAGGTAVNSGGVLALRFGIAVGGEALTLTGTGQSSFGALSSSFGSNTWTGNITLSGNATVSVASGDYLNLSGGVSGGFGLTKTGTGTLLFSGATANSYTGTTTVNAGTLELSKSVASGGIPGALVIGDGSGGANADVVRLLTNNQIADTTDVTINSSGRLDFAGQFDSFDELSGNGNMTFGTGGFVSVGANDGSSTFDGIGSGTGFAGGYTLRKAGTGTITLTGNNTYLNQTRVDAGTIIINGSQSQSPLLVISGGTAGGTGTVGDISCGGNLQPGNSPGCLTSGDVAFSSSGDFYVELAGTTPCSGHDQLVVVGTNNLGNAVLHVVNNFPPGEPSIGDQFVILSNDGADAITGTFSGLPNNSTFTVGDIGYRITYNGGDGNDVVLTVLNAPGASVTITSADRGWYDDTGGHTPGNQNYYVGRQAGGTVYHNWFVFNVPSFTGTIVQAELLINCYSNTSPDAEETLVLRHVSTPIANLVAGGSGLTGIYADLADGPVYGVRHLLKVEAGQRAIIPLNLTFINDATAAAGGQIALGGALSTAGVSGPEEAWFGFSASGSQDVQLRLTFGTSALVNATDRGWYDQAGTHDPVNRNYVVGESGGQTFHNFFVFGLPSGSGHLATAQLSVNSYSNSSPAGFLAYELHDVATPITTLTNTGSGATATYADLANGGLYGGREVFVDERGTRISIPLGYGFIGAAKANLGGQIALGGSIPNLDATPGNENLFLFSNYNNADDAQLWLGFVPATLPSSVFAAGSPIALGGNRYEFVLNGTTGTTNEIQTSTDMVNWDVVRTLYMTNANVTFNVTNSHPNRVFRARLLQ